MNMPATWWRTTPAPAGCCGASTQSEGGESGVETWLKADETLWNVPTGTHPWVQEHPELLDASWKYTGNVGHWAPVTADAELGLFYVATETPTNDYYGGYSARRQPLRQLRAGARRGDRRAGCGIFSSPITNSGTTTSPPPPSSWTSRSTAPRSRRWCNSRSRFRVRGSTAKPANPLADRGAGGGGVGRSGRVDLFRRSPSPPSRRRSERQGVTRDDLIDFTPELRAEALRIRGAIPARPPSIPRRP